MKKDKAFTLVELLVVISIIAVLLAVLMPALSKARISARWIVCGTNLKQWGYAIQGYATENGGKALSTVENINVGPVPAICAINPNLYNAANGLSQVSFTYPTVEGTAIFSIDSIKAYLPGFDVKKLDFDKVWKCPENTLNMNAVVKWHYDKTKDRIRADRNETPFFVVNYSYFGRIDYFLKKNKAYLNPTALAPNSSGLTEKMFTSRLMVMNDTLYQQNGSQGGGWSYNHGKSGPSCHINDSAFSRMAGANRRVADPESNYNSKLAVDATGANQLYGDGSITRKTIRDNSFLNYKKFPEYIEEDTVKNDTQIACIQANGDKSYYFPKR
ncbi:MAG: type II secretion system protein [Phycisphaerales bacterium]